MVEAAILSAVTNAHADLTPATLRTGSASVIGGKHNRTERPEKVKTNAEFNADSTDADRWLDTQLKVLVIERKDRPAVLWYHFSAHCTASGSMRSLAGADWPGAVQKIVRDEKKFSPAFLQGHIGDVAPGPIESGNVAKTDGRTQRPRRSLPSSLCQRHHAHRATESHARAKAQRA